MSYFDIDGFVSQNGIRPADAIIVRKQEWALLDHYVIYLGATYSGDHVFIANYTKGVRILSENEIARFMNTYEPVKLNRFVGDESERREAVNRAMERVDENSYSLILNNCEHYASYVQRGKPQSNQVRNWSLGILGGLALMGLIAAFTSNDDEE